MTIYFEEERRSCDDSDRQEGGKFGEGNDCDGDTATAQKPARVNNSWKSKVEPVVVEGEELQSNPPSKSLAGVNSVVIVDGELLHDSLKALGVTLDQTARACGGLSPEADITVSHGGLKDIAKSLEGDASAERKPHDRVTVLTSMPVADIAGAASVAASLARDDDDDLVMTYTMLKVSEEAQKNAQFAVARQMMKGVVESITNAGKIGVKRVEMLAAGDSSNEKFKGYRIWPRLGFDGVIPRGRVTSTYTLSSGFFNAYGSKLPDSILSPRAREEKKAGALTIQALYETPEGQKWWEENGGNLEMTLDVGDEGSPGWQRFQKIREKFSSRSIDLFSVFSDVEAAYLLDESWAEIRAFCPTGQGNGIDNSCGSNGEKMAADSGGGAGGGSPAKAGPRPATDDWKDERQPVYLSKEQLQESSPVTGGERLDSFAIKDPIMAQEAMKRIGIGSMDDLAALAGGVVRGGGINIDADEDATINTTIVVPVREDDAKSGTIHASVTVSSRIDDDGNQTSHLGFEGLYPSGMDRSSASDVARVSSIMMQRVIESMSKASELGFSSAEMAAVGSPDRTTKGYRLWPQFGFDGQLSSRVTSEIPDSLLEKVWRHHRPDLFATRVPPAAIMSRLRNKTLTIQELIAVPEGDRWWDQNGESISLTFDFKDKDSLGYKRFQKKVAALKRLRDRNEGRSIIEEWIEDLIEERSCDSSDKNADGTFAPDNDCAGDGDGGTPAKEKDVPLGNVRRQEVPLRGGKLTAVVDAEAKERAKEDLKTNPKPEGSHPASSSDLYGRVFVRRDDPKKPNKITSHDPVFADSDLAQNGTFIAHDSVGRLLTDRHEEARRKIGGKGPSAVFDTRRDLPPEQFEYLVSALLEDVHVAYGEGRNPGFYSTDIAECMDIMSSMYPELKDPEEASRRGTTVDDAAFVFTMITAITSNGTDPALNLESADRIYRLYREHGSVRTPDQVMGGERAAEIRKSLDRFQAMIDEFGESRVRNLLSGVTSASTIASTMERMAKKSEEIGGSWKSKDLGSSELADEVVPVAAIFGPKIGSFYANLSGKHQFLTMDRWLMRSVGRVTGELLTRSTPEAANKQANAALKAIKAIPKSKEVLFGVDKPPLNLKREDVIRSLELQARTGIVEESGAAFIWAQAAQRAFSKVPRGTNKDGEQYGSFGKHPDSGIQRALEAGNTITKSLIHEQQDPRSARARSVLRNVFREVARRVAEENPDARGDVQVSEIQAVLWQYEQNLWKRLGAKTKIEGDSLYSAAAKSLKGRRDSGETPESLTPEKTNRPKSVRSYEPQGDSQEVDHPMQSGQDLWDGESETAEFDFVELLKAIAKDVESRAFCATGAGGGIDNSCGSQEKMAPDTGGGSGGGFSSAITEWKLPRSDWSRSSGKPEPFAGADKFAVVDIANIKQVSETVSAMKVTPLQVLEIAGANLGDETVFVRPGHEFVRDTPFLGSDVTPVFVDYSRSLAGVPDGLTGSAAVGMKKSAITGETSMNAYYNMLSVAEAVRKDPLKRQAAAREFYRSVVGGVESAKKAGFSKVFLMAAGEKGDYYKGYTIWPRMGFDGLIPKHVAAKLPPELSHAKTLLDLHATREGTKWWADNGDDVDLVLDLTQPNSPQNQLFNKFVRHFGQESRSGDEWLSGDDSSKIDEMWEEVWDSDILDDYSGEDFDDS
jgi:hypothetical protein